MAVQIIQWNCRGLSANFEELELLISSFSPKIICLQETFLKDNSVTLNGYSSLHFISDRGNKASGGTSTFIRSDIPFSVITINTVHQVVCASITLDKAITICNIYFPPNLTLDYDSIQNIILQLPKPFLLLGDFNAHNPIWGSGHFNTKGRLIENIINNNNLCLLNNNLNTYVHPATGTLSCIDLSICDPTTYTDFPSWEIHNSLCGSDHYPILISSPTLTHNVHPRKWILKKADWPLFVRLCRDTISDDVLHSDCPVSAFTTKILDIANTCIPTSSSSANHRKPWFTPDCKTAILARNRALNKFKLYPSMVNLGTFRLLRAQARRTIKLSKQQFWESYVSSLDAKAAPSKVWRTVNGLLGKNSSSSISHLHSNGNKVTTLKDITNCLASYFADVSSPNHYSQSFLAYKTKTERSPIDFSSDDDEIYNLPFTSHELAMAIKQSKPSSCGPDEIHYDLIKNLPAPSLDTLLKVFNFVWTSDSFPSGWCQSIIIPIFKPGKDRSLPNSYRPIALTSCLCKVLERMINYRLCWFVENNNILSSMQNGFRHFRNSLDHVVKLDTFVREAFVRKSHAIAVFFDIEKAFDTTWRYGILKDLHATGLRGHLPLFIQNFLRQ